MAELNRQGGARPPDFGRLSQSGGEDPAHQITDQLNSSIFATTAKDKGIYNKIYWPNVTTEGVFYFTGILARPYQNSGFLKKN